MTDDSATLARLFTTVIVSLGFGAYCLDQCYVQRSITALKCASGLMISAFLFGRALAPESTVDTRPDLAFAVLAAIVLFVADVLLAKVKNRPMPRPPSHQSKPELLGYLRWFWRASLSYNAGMRRWRFLVDFPGAWLRFWAAVRSDRARAAAAAAGEITPWAD